jgi:hypothetical protein
MAVEGLSALVHCSPLEIETLAEVISTLFHRQMAVEGLGCLLRCSPLEIETLAEVILF